jgi:hypothetical protein
MSLDETGKSVWKTKETPLATFVASRLTIMAASVLTPAVQETFGALSEALVAWWPRRERPPAQIYEQEFTAVLETFEGDEPPAKMQPAVTGAYLQMAGMLDRFPFRALPADRYYDLGEPDFSKWLRSTSKVGRLPLAQLEARLLLLLEHRKSWTDLIAYADRMRWGRSGSWSKLPKRVKGLAKLADLGGKQTWISMGGQQLLQIELDDNKRITALSSEELAALKTVMPIIEQ